MGKNTKLSVNINKIAVLRNSRGGNIPDLLQVAQDCERFGAEGITVHPRSDERHIRYQDVLNLKNILATEFNIEGYPDKRFIDLILKSKPHQVTLVPDQPGQLTSNSGWDVINHKEFLQEIITEFKRLGIRVSIFLEPDSVQIQHAAAIGTERIELYTEAYAKNFCDNRELALAPYLNAAKTANILGIGLNAGHDLNLNNLAYFSQNIPNLLEVSIGHALIADALYAGLSTTIQNYLKQLKKADLNFK